MLAAEVRKMEKMILTHEMDAYDTAFRCLSAIHYSPRTLKNKITTRPRNSFLFIKQGFYRYRSGDLILDIHDGEILYLPKGSTYSYEVLSEDTETLQFEFNSFRISDGESVVLSELPCKFHPEHPKAMEKLFLKIIRYQNEKTPGYDYMVLSAMASIYAYASKTLSAGKRKPIEVKIEPALFYIQQHFREKIVVADLAKMCFMSESQLRRRFEQCIGMSPIAYKNAMQMTTAGELLRAGYTVKVIAENLGLDSVYSFYHMFKKFHGITPQEYRATHLKEE